MRGFGAIEATQSIDQKRIRIGLTQCQNSSRSLRFYGKSRRRSLLHFPCLSYLETEQEAIQLGGDTSLQLIVRAPYHMHTSLFQQNYYEQSKLRTDHLLAGPRSVHDT